MDRIASDDQIMAGVPCVRGTRIPVVTIVGLTAEGLSPSEVIAQFPQLVVEDVFASLRYAADALDGEADPRHE